MSNNRWLKAYLFKMNFKLAFIEASGISNLAIEMDAL